MNDIALSILFLCIIAALGLGLGAIKVKGISLGVGGVLFSGIAVGHIVHQMGIQPNLAPPGLSAGFWPDPVRLHDRHPSGAGLFRQPETFWTDAQLAGGRYRGARDAGRLGNSLVGRRTPARGARADGRRGDQHPLARRRRADPADRQQCWPGRVGLRRRPIPSALSASCWS